MSTNGLYLILILLITWAIVRVLFNRNRDPRSSLNLDDLLLGDDGKMSKAAAVMFGAFAVTTSIIIWLTYKNQMSEGYMAIYVGAWIAPTVTKLIVNQQPSPPPTTAATTTTVETRVQTGS